MRNEGRLHLIYGEPGSGKTFHGIESIAWPLRGPRSTFVFCTNERDDAERFRETKGPVVRNVRELGDIEIPEGICVLGRDGIDDAFALADRIRSECRYRVTLFVDEAHEIWPEKGPGPATDLFNTVRHEKGLTLICASQRPAGLSKALLMSALATGSVRFFRLSMPRDVAWVEENFGPAAALEVAELELWKPIILERGAWPRSWTGHLDRLRRKVARERVEG